MLQGGFLFTTVASCLKWQSTQDGHWCCSALFYASILVALVAVVLASQQMLVLPNRTLKDSNDTAVAVISSVLPQQQIPPPLPVSDTDIEEREKRDFDAMIDRLGVTHHSGKPNWLHVFALQAPIMLLTFAAFFFFAGVCAVVFAPLARHLIWGDEAKASISELTTGTGFSLTGIADRDICGIHRAVLDWHFLSDLVVDAWLVQRSSR